jgi:hypothetical protein
VEGGKLTFRFTAVTSYYVFKPLISIGLPPLPLSFSNNLRGVSFNNDAELQNWLDDFFTAKMRDFFKREIENLPERWGQS